MNPVGVYLAGRCKGLEDEGKGWRKNATDLLNQAAAWVGSDIKVFDPIKYFSYSEPKQQSHKQVKNYYLERMSKCELVLVNLNGTNFSIGTAQEIQFAVDHNIPVIGFGDDEVYPWISDVDCQAVFHSLFEAVDYIRDHYL